MDYDICVIGGGVNGAGIARDAQGRGLSTVLLEARDLASATSSASTKLIHGGLRYLENYEFRLVRDALREREVLLHAAPHIIWPMTFVLPHRPHLRPAWMIKAGLFLYDYLAGRSLLHGSKTLDCRTHPMGVSLNKDIKEAFAYSDCWVEDSRLVALNALDARDRGADVLTRTAVIGVKVNPHHFGWVIRCKDMITHDEFEITAKAIVNAAGPWVRSVLDHAGLSHTHTPSIRHVKGSHIIVPRLYEGEQCYTLQQPDGRIVFTIPYEQHFTLIGTTDVEYQGDPSVAQIDQEEIEYLCTAVNESLSVHCKAEDVVWSYSGVRPLIDDPSKKASKVTRDYKLVMDISFGPPLLSVFGGKLTTYRKLSEQVMGHLKQYFPKAGRAWTAKVPLPGGDIPRADFSLFVRQQRSRYHFLPPDLVARYARAYGTRMDVFLQGVRDERDLGEHYGDGVYEAEVMYLVLHEFVRTAEDMFWRRSKLGLHVSTETYQSVEKALPKIFEKLEQRP